MYQLNRHNQQSSCSDLNNFFRKTLSSKYCEEVFCNPDLSNVKIPTKESTQDDIMVNLAIQFTRFNKDPRDSTFTKMTCNAKGVNYINSKIRRVNVAGCALITYSNFLVIVFTGTYNRATALIDEDYKQVPAWNINRGYMHSGFKHYYDGMSNDILNYVTTYRVRNPSNKIYITGISLGGAMASICGYALYAAKIDTNVITFASPRVFNPRAANHINKRVNIVRWNNSSDIVPSLPPAIYKYDDEPIYYQHVGNSMQFTRNWYSYYKNHVLSYAIHFDILQLTQ